MNTSFPSVGLAVVGAILGKSDLVKNCNHPRDGKDVYIGSDWKEITYQAEDGTTEHATIRMGYEIIERPIDKKGPSPLIPDIEANVWWTNTGFTDREVIGHYHAHGESELMWYKKS